MSGRPPPAPRISTSHSQRRRGPGSRQPSYANSPTSANAPQQKRHYERGNSPPRGSKRVRTTDPPGYSTASRPPEATDGRRPPPSTSNRPRDDQRRSSVVQSLLHVQSPGGGSGASILVHGAPPVPSILPRVGDALTLAASTNSQESMTFSSLRKHRDRKIALGIEANVKGGDFTSGQVLKAQLKAQQIEINLLKEDRKNMSKQLESLKDLPRKIQELNHRLDQRQPPHDAHALVQKDDKIEQQTKDISTWKSQQWTPSQMEAKLNELLTKEEFSKKLETFQKERQTAATQLNNRINDEHKTILSLLSGFQILDKFKKDFEGQNVQEQLKRLGEKLNKVAENEGKTWNTVSAMKDDLHLYIGPIKKAFELSHNTTLVDRLHKLGMLIGQVKNCQSGQSKMFHDCKKLTTEQANFSEEQEKLTTRVAALERSITSTSGSSNNSSPKVMLQRLDKVDKDIESLQALPSQVTRLDGRAKGIVVQAERVKAIEAQSTQLTELSKKMTAMEQSMSSFVKVEDIQNLTTSFSRLEAKVTDVETRGPAASEPVSGGSAGVAKLASQLVELNKAVTSLEESMDKAEESLHDHTSRLEIVETEVPKLFKEDFDPLKKTTNEKFESVEQALSSMDNAIKELKQQSQRTQSPAQRNTAAPDARFRQYFSKMQSTMQLAQREIGLLKDQMSTKADKAAIVQQMDHFTVSFKSLQDQYNNITTDELHSRMVQWFLQNYPSNAAAMLQQYARLQEEVNALKSLSAKATWIQSRSQDLHSLLAVAPLVQEFLKTATEIRMPQLLDKINTACNECKQAVTTAAAAETKVALHTNVITSLQQSLHNLNAPSSLLASTQKVQALENSLGELRNAVETGLLTARDERIQAINEIRTAAGTDHDQRVKEAQAIKTMITSCTTAVESLAGRTTSIEQFSGTLRSDVDTINDKFITPNHELFALFPNLMVCIAQLQYAVGCINESLHYGKIPYGGWKLDLSDMVSDNFVNGDGKGKGKQ